MSVYKPLDDRQILNRAVLQQLFPYVGSQTLDVLMSSINQDLTVPLNVTANNPADLTINVGPAIVTNSESNRKKTISFIGALLPNSFAGTTVTFPSASGGSITTGQGGSYSLTLPSGDFVAVLLALNSLGTVVVNIGTPTSSLPSVVVPSPTFDTDPFSYVILSNVGGTIQNVIQSSIFQFSGGGGGSSTSIAPTTSVATTSTFSGGFSAAGSGTYTPPVGTLYVRIRMVGGGGSGAGFGPSIPVAGNAGTNTTFSTFLSAGGGSGGAEETVPGGVATFSSPAAGIAINGGGGGAGNIDTSNSLSGGVGGSSAFGGAGAGAPRDSTGGNASTNSGSGGGGGGSTGSGFTGSGGGSGGYIDVIVSSPSGGYSYTVGVGGTAVGNSGNGADGIIIIDEYYQ